MPGVPEAIHFTISGPAVAVPAALAACLRAMSAMSMPSWSLAVRPGASARCNGVGVLGTSDSSTRCMQSPHRYCTAPFGCARAVAWGTTPLHPSQICSCIAATTAHMSSSSCTARCCAHTPANGRASATCTARCCAHCPATVHVSFTCSAGGVAACCERCCQLSPAASCRHAVQNHHHDTHNTCSVNLTQTHHRASRKAAPPPPTHTHHPAHAAASTLPLQRHPPRRIRTSSAKRRCQPAAPAPAAGGT